MNLNEKTWKIPKQLDNRLHFDYLPEEILEILSRRGLKTTKEIDKYLYPEIPPNPYEDFPDLERAINRIISAKVKEESVIICGDYDADGMTSTALLTDVLERLEINVNPLIPSRSDDGYGLNINIIKKIDSLGIKLVITVDNGVSAIDSLNYAHSVGIDVIVTDHHKINTTSKKLYALIHPETCRDESPYRYLAGVGVAYILASELGKRLNNIDCLRIAKDLLCIGTIADMAQLKGVNRYWLKKYMPELINTKSLGLKKLISRCYTKKREMTSEDISFGIAPRINSVGRISNPELVINCLLENNKKKAIELADKCEEINKRRKFITKQAVEEAIAIMSNKNIRPFIVIAQSHWHQGIIGLIAARIMEKYKRPTAILTRDKDGFLRGSVRSPKGFDVSKALESSSTYLEKYGGHSCAGGFTVEAKNLSLLESSLINYADNTLVAHMLYNIEPDVYIGFDSITTEFTNKLKLLEPFGIGNIKPLFWTRGCKVLEKKVLYGGHRIVTFKQRDILIKGMVWNKNNNGQIPEIVDIAFNIEQNMYSKDNETQITVQGIKPFREKEILKSGNRIYKCYLSNENEMIIENQDDKKLTFNLLNKSIYPKEINNNIYIKNLISAAQSSLGVKNHEKRD